MLRVAESSQTMLSCVLIEGGLLNIPDLDVLGPGGTPNFGRFTTDLCSRLNDGAPDISILLIPRPCEYIPYTARGTFQMCLS